jgi:PAS domain S-box-containing protein
LYESPSFYRVFGYSEEDTINKNIFHFVHPDDVERVVNEFSRGLEKVVYLI